MIFNTSIAPGRNRIEPTLLELAATNKALQSRSLRLHSEKLTIAVVNLSQPCAFDVESPYSWQP